MSVNHPILNIKLSRKEYRSIRDFIQVYSSSIIKIEGVTYVENGNYYHGSDVNFEINFIDDEENMTHSKLDIILSQEDFALLENYNKGSEVTKVIIHMKKKFEPLPDKGSCMRIIEEFDIASNIPRPDLRLLLSSTYIDHIEGLSSNLRVNISPVTGFPDREINGKIAYTRDRVGDLCDIKGNKIIFDAR